MDYYKLFRLKKEPFSNTPDPEFFFRSIRHAECLQKLEIAIRLRRGLAIVRGEVGTGKTTLCRQLVRILSEDENISVHMILDPGFDRTRDFAASVNAMFSGRENALSCATTAEHKEMLKNHLFETGVDQGRTTVLIIDEGQKLPSGCMEFLRELLNYETNQEKLLQIIIFAQNEIADLLLAHSNFADRAALCHHLQPLRRKETARLIEYRLKAAGSGDGKSAAGPVFTRRAISRIHRISKGYPRKIVHLGHNILLLLLVRGKTRVTPAIVRHAAASLPTLQKSSAGETRRRWTAGISLAAALAGVIVMGAYAKWPSESASEPESKAAVQENHQRAKGPQTAKINPYAAKATSPAAEHPDNLGWVRINADEKLWNMIHWIYGSGQADMLRAVQRANPNLTNPDQIRPGQKIRFPALAPRPVPKKRQYWIVLQTFTDLNPIYQFVFARGRPDLRVLSFWHPSTGLQHAAVMKTGYGGAEAAGQALAAQAKNLDDQAEILDLSKPGIKLCGWYPKS